MEKHGIFFYIFIAVILLLCLRIYYDSDAFNLKCIIASKDGNTYCVREREKLELAANLLAEVTQKMKDMVAYMKKRTQKTRAQSALLKDLIPKKSAKHYQQVS